MMLFPDNWFGKIMPLINDQGFIIVGSISQIGRLPAGVDMSKVILYNWDVYPWQDRSSGEWKAWGKLMRDCRDIWHASMATFRRTEQLYGISKGKVIRTFCPVDWLGDGELSDEEFVLMPMRDYPHDECFNWAEQACVDLNIKLLRPRRSLSIEEYSDAMRSCTLILSPYAEASTGGLGMIEGKYFNKPVLANTSFFNGAREHMGTQATYFDEFDDLKAKLQEMFHAKQDYTTLKANRQWVKDNYDIKVMATQINETLLSYI